MNIFGRLYDQTMQWSRHRLAPFWLVLVSFIEAIFFPIPPDVMLAPMSMSSPKNALRYGLYAALASVAGGIIGYLLGVYAFDFVHQYIVQWGYEAHWQTAMSWFERWGVLIVFLAGFSPIPYKVFTICAGVMHMAFLPFVITALISRAARFMLIAKLAAWGGQRFAAQLRRYIEIIGWGVVALAVVAYFILR